MAISPEDVKVYEIRIKRFEEQRNAAKSVLIRALLEDAILLSEICVQVYVDTFVPGFQGYVNRLKEGAGSLPDSGAYIEALRNELEAASKMSSERDQREQLEWLGIQISAAKNQIEIQKALVNANVEIVKTVANLYQSILFEKVFREDDAKYAVNALLALLEFAIDLSPVGVIVSGLQKLRDIIIARKNEINEPDDYISNIEHFLLATRIWAVSAYLTFTNLPADPNDRITEEAAEKHIDELVRARKRK
jgi:hypothetical protein